jgi:PIN domain nuclease of toxin-antitoxin system
VTYLLDTGVWLWSVGEPSRISRKARDVMADISHDVFLSAVTSWEVAIKAASGKLQLPEPPDLYVPRRMAAQGLRPLAVSREHALAVFALPAHHRDPFDRLLIGQAKVEEMTLISADRMFDRYPVQLLWAGR